MVLVFNVIKNYSFPSFTIFLITLAGIMMY